MARRRPPGRAAACTSNDGSNVGPCVRRQQYRTAVLAETCWNAPGYAHRCKTSSLSGSCMRVVVESMDLL
eukprot:4392944-Prymnesium_polylepis.1